MNGTATVVWCVGVLGLVLLALGLREFPLQRRLRRSGVRVAGTVVRFDRGSPNEGGSHSYFAVVGFTDADGNRGEAKSISSGTKRWPLGHEVPIVYPQGAPSRARIDMRSERVGNKLLPLVAGALCTALPFLYTFL